MLLEADPLRPLDTSPKSDMPDFESAFKVLIVVFEGGGVGVGFVRGLMIHQTAQVNEVFLVGLFLA